MAAIGRMSSVTRALVLLLGAAVFLNYVDRGAVGIAAPLMQGDLGLSATEFGLIASAFFWIYGPVQLLVGWLCDRFNVYRLMTIGLLLWAVATLFHLGSFGKLTAFNHFLLAAAALAVIVRPASVAALSMLAGLQLYDVALDLPTASNHWLFTGFVNLTLLFCVARAVWTRDRPDVQAGPRGPDAWMPGFAPLARLDPRLPPGVPTRGARAPRIFWAVRTRACGATKSPPNGRATIGTCSEYASNCSPNPASWPRKPPRKRLSRT